MRGRTGVLGIDLRYPHLLGGAQCRRCFISDFWEAVLLLQSRRLFVPKRGFPTDCSKFVMTWLLVRKLWIPHWPIRGYSKVEHRMTAALRRTSNGNLYNDQDSEMYICIKLWKPVAKTWVINNLRHPLVIVLERRFRLTIVLFFACVCDSVFTRNCSNFSFPYCIFVQSWLLPLRAQSTPDTASKSSFTKGTSPTNFSLFWAMLSSPPQHRNIPIAGNRKKPNTIINYIKQLHMIQKRVASFSYVFIQTNH